MPEDLNLIEEVNVLLDALLAAKDISEHEKTSIMTEILGLIINNEEIEQYD